jgi:hypothetical protein
MAVEITVVATRLRGDAGHSVDTHWVDLKMIDSKTGVDISLFFTGPRAREMADAYAAAINAVDRTFHGLNDILRKHAERV